MTQSKSSRICTLIALAIVPVVVARAGYVTPKIGGAQIGPMQAPMIMPEVSFDGTAVQVLGADGKSWPVLSWDRAPVLRPLVFPDAFEPGKPWAVLTGKAYNFQYGWDSALLDPVAHPLPLGSAIWVRVLRQTPGLEGYDKDGGYAPLFGTWDSGGKPSPDLWMWDKRMHHNIYAVPASFYGRLSADYQIYLGDAVTGKELADPDGRPRYQSAAVTLRWLRPCPCVLPGDINSDCVVDSNDLVLLANQWLTPSCSAPDWCDACDLDHSGDVDMVDMTLLMDNWSLDCREPAAGPASKPNP
jgi:hypothetical protein